MSKVKQIDTNETQLSKLGLTYDLIMDGEYATLDVEKKVKRKGQYVDAATVEVAIGAYAKDLLEAYEVIDANTSYTEELEAENAKMREDLENAVEAFEGTKKQLNQILASEDGLSATESMLSRLEANIGQLETSKTADAQEIKSLKEKVVELEANKRKVEDLAEEVNDVLSNLKQYFEEEGLEYE